MSQSRFTLGRLAHAEAENLIRDNDSDFCESIAAEGCFFNCVCEYSSSNDCMLHYSDTVSDNQVVPALGDYGEDFHNVGWRWRLSDSESDDDNADVESVGRLEQNLGEWSIEYNVSHSAVGALLRTLKPYHPTLPLDPRTLLKTPSNFPVKSIGGGEYCHIGFEKGLSYLINSQVSTNHLKLQFNVDGIPLFKSSSLSLWPVLCLIHNIGYKEPFVVGLFCGKEKPSSASEFLSEFVADLLSILSKGLSINGKTYSFSIHSFVCDAPARAFVKGIKSHSGYASCEIGRAHV